MYQKRSNYLLWYIKLPFYILLKIKCKKLHFFIYFNRGLLHDNFSRRTNWNNELIVFGGGVVGGVVLNKSKA
jgi:hypothetical protein